MRFGAISASILILILTHFAAAQSLPSKIRGYKVYKSKVSVRNAEEPMVQNDSDVSVRLFSPQIKDITLSGAIIEVRAEITATHKAGSVDFMTCGDLRVNGIPIEIEEYAHPFSFKEGEKITLPTPATIFIKTANVAKAAYKELIDSKKDWIVTGTVFVFGKFKKFGFDFKRVVPVKIALTIKNPLNSLTLNPR